MGSSPFHNLCGRQIRESQERPQSKGKPSLELRGPSLEDMRSSEISSGRRQWRGEVRGLCGREAGKRGGRAWLDSSETKTVRWPKPVLNCKLHGQFFHFLSLFPRRLRRRWEHQLLYTGDC